MKRKHLLRTCGLILGVAALAACSRFQNDFSQFHAMPERNWGYYYHLIFDIVPEDSVVTGQLDLVVCHTNDYPFSNLYVEVTESANGHTLKCDTVSVELADVYGNWLGSGLGTSFQRRVTLEPRFTVTDSARVRIRHVMRVDPVPELEQIGVIFTTKL